MLHPENLPFWFIERPERIVVLGKAILLGTTLLMIAAAYGQIMMVVASSKFLARDKLIPERLADLNLSFPTWFIAETLMGYIVITIVAGFGLYLVYYGRHIKRIVDSF